LNACGSGLSGDWTKDSAEAAFGLGNAFLLAGVGHVIVALGDVADDHSASFSEVFYQYLGRGEPVGKSLQLAGAVSGIERVSGRNYVLYGLPQSTVQGILDPDSSRKGSEETVLKVFLFSDLVDSMGLKSRLGDFAAASIFSKHDVLFRECLNRFGGFEEKDTGDGFLASFSLPSQAIRCALTFQKEIRNLDVSVDLHVRMGLHMGEIIRFADSDRDNGHEKLVGLILDTTARVMELALPNQILLTRGLFDSARQHLVTESGKDPIEWCAHGPFLIKGLEEPIEIFEVGIPGISPLRMPEDTSKARSAVAAGEEVALGWRPAVGNEIPFRDKWLLVENLGEGGFGEVWLARHEKTKDRRVFKFCFEADRMRGLKREVTLFRLIRQTLGNRDDIVKLLDWNFEETPYFIETEYTSGGDLKTWADEKGGLEKVPLDTRLEIIAQAADALAAAHSVGIIHKDIKARNILISADIQGEPEAVLTDFGIGQIEDSNLLLAQGITATGVTRTSSTSSSQTGTRLYMAPELLEGKVGATTADIYSLGVLLYQVVCGDLSRALATGWERDVPDEFLREDIALCVDHLPEQRIQSANEISSRLRNLNKRHIQKE
ncbi:MAG: protein kinase, partial [Candidatus Omnitrophica bacterium]|nr:protein kinase [Candidatus Omnitrophota bacterium]